MKKELRDIQGFLSTLELKNRSKNTIESYRAGINQFIEFLCNEFNEEPGRELLRKIDEQIIDNFVLHLKENKMSNATINNRLAALKTFYIYLYKRKIINNEIKDNMCLYEGVKLEKKESVYMTLNEAELFLETSKQVSSYNYIERDYTIILLMLTLGLRISEVVKLNVNDLDLIDKKIKIKLSKGQKDRTLDIPNELNECLTQYLDYRKDMNIEGNHLFFSIRKSRITDNGLRDLINRIKDKSGIDKHITPHKLRHTCASLLRRSGASVEDIKEILGHEKVETTMIYAHANDESVKNAINSNPLLHKNN